MEPMIKAGVAVAAIASLLGCVTIPVSHRSTEVHHHHHAVAPDAPGTLRSTQVHEHEVHVMWGDDDISEVLEEIGEDL